MAEIFTLDCYPEGVGLKLVLTITFEDGKKPNEEKSKQLSDAFNSVFSRECVQNAEIDYGIALRVIAAILKMDEFGGLIYRSDYELKQVEMLHATSEVVAIEKLAGMRIEYFRDYANIGKCPEGFTEMQHRLGDADFAKIKSGLDNFSEQLAGVTASADKDERIRARFVHSIENLAAISPNWVWPYYYNDGKGFTYSSLFEYNNSANGGDLYIYSPFESDDNYQAWHEFYKTAVDSLQKSGRILHSTSVSLVQNCKFKVDLQLYQQACLSLIAEIIVRYGRQHILKLSKSENELKNILLAFMVDVSNIDNNQRYGASPGAFDVPGFCPFRKTDGDLDPVAQ